MALSLPPEHERAEAPWIDGREEGVAHRYDGGEGSLTLRESVPYLGLDRVLPGPSDEVHDHLGVRRRLEERPLLDERLPQLLSVGEIAVVRDREVAPGVPNHDRLRVLRAASPCGRVPHVSHGARALERVEVLRGEDVRDEPGPLPHSRDAVVVDHTDARRLLTSVL